MVGTSMGRTATWIQPSFRQVAAPARCVRSKETEYYNSETCWQEERREARRRAKRWPFVSGAWRGVEQWEWVGGEHG